MFYQQCLLHGPNNMQSSFLDNHVTVYTKVHTNIAMQMRCPDCPLNSMETEKTDEVDTFYNGQL